MQKINIRAKPINEINYRKAIKSISNRFNLFNAYYSFFMVLKHKNWLISS